MTVARWHSFFLGAAFLALFGLYVWTAGPSLVPYRDAGEMAASGPTLGVLHPTSYPVYSLVSRLACAVPLGNAAYRLNIFSAAAMGVAWLFLFLLLEARGGTESAGWAVLWAAVSYEFWWHALVSEMYTLNLLFIALLLWTIFNDQIILAGLLFGIGLANRSDLLLTLPALVILRDSKRDSNFSFQRRKEWAAAGAVAAGLLLYAYLPLRAAQRPWLNWDDPSTIERFIRSVLRLAYGGTLDLLSTAYASGENFISEFWLYGQHLFRDFTPIALPVAGAGLWTLWKHSRRWFWATLVGWLATAPVFIWMANLPPNPHAVAIMEAAYLVPDMFFVLWLAAGVSRLLQTSSLRWPCRCLLAGSLLWQGFTAYGTVSKRDNFTAVDYASNVFRSMPAHSLVFARSDVPIFNLFYAHYVQPRPADRWPLAQGLVGSPWYQEVIHEQTPSLFVSVLKSNEDWRRFAQGNPTLKLFATPDLDWPDAPRTGFSPMGLLSQYQSASSPAEALAQSDRLLRTFYRRRGVYRYGYYRDFFTNEIVDAYAQGYYQLGQAWVGEKQNAKAVDDFECALADKPDHAYAALQKAYAHYLLAQWADALRDYARAASLFRQLVAESVEWKSFPSIREGLIKDEAQSLAQAGFVSEHRGDPSQAPPLYERALSLDPDNADVNYNLAVLYWKKGEWAAVVEHLQRMARAHPDDPRWKPYLGKAIEHLQRH